MICFPVSGGTPDNSLPDGGVSGGRPDQGLPSLPNYPSTGLPGGGSINLPGNPIVVPPAFPDQGLPPAVWPGVPVHPGTPANPINLPPGAVWPPLPPAAGSSGKAVILAAIPGVGVRWVVIDLAARPMPK